MSAEHALQMPDVARVVMVDGAGGLARIHDADTAAVIWRRAAPHGFQPWIDAVSETCLPSVRVILHRAEIATTASDACAVLPPGAGREQLAVDLAVLSTAFADAMRARFLRLRLDVTEAPACPRFHIDAVRARLVCTYRGRGTQCGTPRESGGIDGLCELAPLVPAIFKGTGWPGPAPTLLHRSPPCDGTGKMRLTCVIDAVDDPEEAE